ncbi:MAG: SagB/ThcOx family dehydrogenase [Puniceicoccales bacterium]|jgi:nitroreductase|nr:SagB/ThcOx family dehydrogenase [Puniceicoccales bacterium]
MKRLSPTKHFLAATLFAAMEILNAQAAATELPAPQKTGGKPLMETLAARATRRDYNPDAPALTQAQLSNLLWAAYGINRDDGRRTAPSALNRQDITLYVLLKTGTYTYDATRHALIPVEIAGKNIGDIRAISGRQSFAGNAQLSLVYVSDFSRLGKPDADPEAREMAAISAGAIAQNAALFCASEGLLTGVRMSIDKEKLGAALGLKKSQWISLAQSVGTKDTQ